MQKKRRANFVLPNLFNIRLVHVASICPIFLFLQLFKYRITK